jgi:hypothetical protein
MKEKKVPVSPRIPVIVQSLICALFLLFFNFYLLSFTAYAFSPELIDLLKGSKIYAQDINRTFLGCIDNECIYDSVFNEVGPYGSDCSPKSIWSEVGSFGSDVSFYSPYNAITLTPPMIVKNGQIIGFLTVNPSVEGRLSPFDLKKMKNAF